jgi:phthalate 4,5-dioxygenase oxygenase subunit
MPSRRDSETLARVGPGTAMGELMRQCWLPAAKSEELVADGDPVRFMLLGEKLIAFRDTSGRVGVMDHRCPHRCASLFFGRTRRTASVASIMAGSSMWAAIAWIWPMFRPIRT